MSRVDSQKFLVEVEFGLLDDINEVFKEYFYDSMYDRDAFLAETHAELDCLLFRLKKEKQ